MVDGVEAPALDSPEGLAQRNTGPGTGPPLVGVNVDAPVGAGGRRELLDSPEQPPPFEVGQRAVGRNPLGPDPPSAEPTSCDLPGAVRRPVVDEIDGHPV